MVRVLSDTAGNVTPMRTLHADAIGERPHYLQPLLRTPFHPRLLAWSQLDRFVPWSGYITADVLSNVEQEYFAIRNACTLYDLTPMVKYRVAGPAAQRYLNRLLTRDVSKLAVGRVAYCIWCDDAGHLIDDGTLFRLSDSDYRLCTAERQLDWLCASAIGFEQGSALQIEEVTTQIAALALQGPTSCAVLKAAGLSGVERLRPFDVKGFELAGCPVSVSRTGFTGDLGYELWMSPQHALTVWDRLIEAGHSRGIRPIGSQALNMARIEAGYLAPHIDFVSSAHTTRPGTDRSPFELGLGWQLSFDKGHFTGRRALLAERSRAPRRRLARLDIEGTRPAHQTLLYADRHGRRPIGSVTSAMWSPSAKSNIALAMLDAPYFAAGASVWAEIYVNRELVWERRIARARVVEQPFFAPERRTLTPPRDF
jgi:aminomethyltransferase